jgi:hypothetical protein
MHRIETMPDRISSSPDQPALPVLTERAKAFITARLAQGEKPERIAAGLRARFAIAIDPAQVIPYWKGEIPRATQTEPSPDKESVQLPADRESEPLFTRMPDGETPPVTPRVMPEATPEVTPEVTPEIAPEVIPEVMPEVVMPQVTSESARRESPQTPQETGPATQTGHRRNEDSLCIPVDTVDEPTAHDRAMHSLADLARARLGIAPAATETGLGPDRKAPTVLSDEVKAFIVRGLARYETPSRVAAAVQTNFGIEIDRRQVFAYDPAGSRPPAQRWIDLHAATRAKFMGAMAEIGIAQKLVRVRMLDRYANRADGNNQMERAAAFMAQAAKECGGFYERYQRPTATAAPST